MASHGAAGRLDLAIGLSISGLSIRVLPIAALVLSPAVLVVAAEFVQRRACSLSDLYPICVTASDAAPIAATLPTPVEVKAPRQAFAKLALAFEADEGQANSRVDSRTWSRLLAAIDGNRGGCKSARALEQGRAGPSGDGSGGSRRR